MPEDYTFIAGTGDLAPLLEAVEQHTTIAIDTEADSMHHYHEKLCLIQLGVGEHQWIVDPLCGLDLTPLLALLGERELLFHGADYDLRLLYRTYQFTPTRIFDTMLAAQLLGKPRIGLAALVQDYCEIILPKEGQKADWSRRPLPEDLLHYAAGDTRHLAHVAGKLHGELSEKRRLAWHGELCRRLIGITREPRRVSDEDPWRIKGGKHLIGRPAAVLRELWHWREEHACQSDRPPFKIASTEFLLHWAHWAAEHPGAGVEEAPARPEWLRGGRLHSFEKALDKGLNLPAADCPGPPASRGGFRSTREEEALLKLVLDARDALAAQLELDPGVLAPREALRGLVHERPRSMEEAEERSTLMAWQNECLLPVILPILQADGQVLAGDD